MLVLFIVIQILSPFYYKTGTMGQIGSTSYVLPIRLSYCTLNRVMRVWNIIFDFSTFSVGCYFLKKLVYETQISAPPKDTRHHISRKLLVLLSLRAISLQYEIPCNMGDICKLAKMNCWLFSTHSFSNSMFDNFFFFITAFTGTYYTNSRVTNEKGLYVRTHDMFSRILNFLFVIVFSRKKLSFREKK